MQGPAPRNGPLSPSPEQHTTIRPLPISLGLCLFCPFLPLMFPSAHSPPCSLSPLHTFLAPPSPPSTPLLPHSPPVLGDRTIENQKQIVPTIKAATIFQILSLLSFKIVCENSTSFRPCCHPSPPSFDHPCFPSKQSDLPPLKPQPERIAGFR